MTEDTSDHESVLAPLRAKYGRIDSFTVEGLGLIVLAAPENPLEYDRFLSVVTKPDGDMIAASKGIVKASIVYPAASELKPLFERTQYRGTLVQMCAKVQKLCSTDLQDLGKD